MMPSVPSRADKQLLQVVAGVVLAQRAQAVPDRAVWQHHFEAEHEIARIAVAQHLHAAGVGGNVAADLAGALCAEAQRKQAICGIGGGLDVLQNHAGVDRDGVVARINGADGLHARGGDDHLAQVGVRLAAARKARVAALRDDGNASVRADAHDGGHLLRALGTQDGRHRALPVVAPALAVGGDVGRVLDDTGRADGGTQTVDDGTRNGRRRAEGCCHEAGLACKSGAHAA